MDTQTAPETPTTYPEHVPQYAVIHEQPAPNAPKSLKHLFSKASASLAGKRSVEARRKRKQEAEEAAKTPPNPAPLPNVAPSVQHTEELRLVQKQITRMEEQLDEKMDPGERAQLVRALDLMLDRKRILQERPLPGSRRPAPEGSRNRSPSFLAPDSPAQTPQGTGGQDQE